MAFVLVPQRNEERRGQGGQHDVKGKTMTANLQSETPTSPKRHWLIEFVVVISVIATLLAFVAPPRRSAGPSVRRIQCVNNLKQITLALHDYVMEYKTLPPAYTVDGSGRPLHSWRTLILPYLGAKPLYDKIDLAKAWDDPANAEAYQSVAFDSYRCPEAKCPTTHTTYMAVVTSNSCFRPTEPRSLSDITDPQSETLLVVELHSDQAVHWMAPLDADEKLFLGLGPKSKYAHNGGMNAAFVDGRTEFLEASLSTDRRQALISISGNDNGPELPATSAPGNDHRKN